jgi:hypothetical protein
MNTRGSCAFDGFVNEFISLTTSRQQYKEVVVDPWSPHPIQEALSSPAVQQEPSLLEWPCGEAHFETEPRDMGHDHELFPAAFSFQNDRAIHPAIVSSVRQTMGNETTAAATRP